MIRIAIQSKGRLNEQSVELLQDAGLNVNDQKRKFLDRVDNFPIEILYLRDDDIPQVVANGTASLGIVGLNEVAERGCDVEVVKKLGFGGCRISLAIPKGEQYNGVEYFQGKRIATSYPNVLKNFFAEKGIDAKYEDVLADMIKRDYDDSHRAIAPLKQADDAVLVDTIKNNFFIIISTFFFAKESL